MQGESESIHLITSERAAAGYLSTFSDISTDTVCIVSLFCERNVHEVVRCHKRNLVFFCPSVLRISIGNTSIELHSVCVRVRVFVES